MPHSVHAFEHIRELFSAFGPVSIRRMFGGAGIYADGIMFAIYADEAIYIKADKATIPAFEREGCSPFSYQRRDGRRAAMSYWKLPDRLYDDPAELATWAHAALAIARVASDKPPPLERTNRSAKARGAARGRRA